MPEVGDKVVLREAVGHGVGSLAPGLHMEVVEVTRETGAGPTDKPNAVLEFEADGVRRRFSVPITAFHDLFKED